MKRLHRCFASQVLILRRGKNQGITLAVISLLNVLPIYAHSNENVHYGFGMSNGKAVVVIDGANSIGVATDDNIRIGSQRCLKGGSCRSETGGSLNERKSNWKEAMLCQSQRMQWRPYSIL